MATIIDAGNGSFIAGDPPTGLDLGQHWCDWCRGDGIDDYDDGGWTICGGCDGRGVRDCSDTACVEHSSLHPLTPDPVQTSWDDERECEAYRPGTMGYQFCWRPDGHDGPHRCQGYPMYSDWEYRDGEIVYV